MDPPPRHAPCTLRPRRNAVGPERAGRDGADAEKAGKVKVERGRGQGSSPKNRVKNSKKKFSRCITPETSRNTPPKSDLILIHFCPKSIHVEKT